MSMIHCTCGENVDTDYNAEHFDDDNHKET